MRRLLALLCTIAILCSCLNLAVFASAEDDAAQNVQSTEATGVITLQEDTADLTVTEDTYLDLNGYDITNVVVTGGTLYCSDSKTDDYAVADGDYGKITGTIEGNVVADQGYLQIAEADGISFHCVNLEIYAMTLRPDAAGVYYTSNFAGDEKVAAQVETYGVALSVRGEPAEGFANCGYSQFTGFQAGLDANKASTTLLKNIMNESNTDRTNTNNANTKIYGRAYIQTAEGTVFGESVCWTLKELVEAIDKVWNDGLQESQKAALVELYNSYTATMGTWALPNLRSFLLQENDVPTLDTEITLPIAVENADGVVAQTVTVEKDGVSITVEAGTKLADGVESLTLVVTPKAGSDSGLALQNNQIIMPVDIHVEGISPENTVPVTVALGKVMPENLNLGNYKTYHVENGKANEMTLIAADAEFTAHNQYKYTLDGELTLHMATFSEFVSTVVLSNPWQGEIDYSWYDIEETELYIRNADQLAGLSAIVGGMVGQTQDSFAGKTVTLLSDIDLGDAEETNDPNKIFYPIGYYNSDYTYEKSGTAITSGFETFEGTFDGNGHTISNIYQNTWEMKGDHNWYDATLQYYRDGMGLFGKVYGGTVKNLTVRNFKSDGEITTTGVIAAYADFGATFENIAIFDCNPRVYNIGNGGIVGCVGWYTMAVTDEKVSFKNITVDNSNKISALWGSWDVACGGLVGQYYPTSGQSSAGSPANAGIYMENCHISAQMDVYNDVCANYQYYAYRYAGILIGSVRENVTVDGRVYPKMDGIEAKACTVHFGDWNDYYYCELVANTTASYTHDYQMSRLVEVKAIEGTTITYLDGTTGTVPASGRANYVIVDYTKGHGTENATCYHFLDGAVWTHEMGGIDEGIDENGDGQDDLKEDKQHIYREFNNLVTGYGWGVTSKAVGEMEGVTILDAVSDEKFISRVDDGKKYIQGATFALGDLFAADTTLSINSESFWANAVDTETGYDVATFTPNAEDWTKSTLSFDGDFTGTAKITVQDYQFCTPTTLTVNLVDFLQNEDTEFYCDACGDTFTWIPLTAGESIGSPAEGAHVHYFVYDKNRDVTAGLSDLGVIANVGKSTICLHLNGHNLIADAGFNFEYGAGKLNIMGEGTITYTGKGTNARNAAFINAKNGQVNLYNVNLIDAHPTDDKPIYLGGTNTMVYLNVYDGANIFGTVQQQRMRGLSLSGDCYIQELILNETTAVDSNAMLTVNSDFTGIVRNFSFPAELTDTDTVIDYSTCETLAGTITTADNQILGAVDGKLAVTGTLEAAPEKTLSNPDEHGGKSYCQACDQVVEWWPYLGNDTTLFRNTADVFHYHIYLTEDVVYTGTNANGNFMFTNENICLHLNGHNITGSTESANLGLRTITHTHAMNIMGEGTITAGNVISESGAVILNSGKLEEIPAVIYEGVTLKNAEGADAPVVTANGDVTLYGTVEGSMVQRKGTLTIGATGAVDQVTLATTDAKLVIAEGWNGNMVLDATAVMDKNYRIPVENAAVEGELTGTITTTDGFELEIIYGQLGVRMEFDAAEELNYCEHCHEFVAWTPLVAGEFMQEDGSDTPVVSTDKHYYVDGAETDVEIGAHSRGVLAQISSGATVCLHLNGHNMISKGNIYAYAGATLNIMGEGTVTYTGEYAGSFKRNYSFIYTDRAYVNLYGGTYVSTDAAKSIYWNYSADSTLTVRGDARVEGIIDCVSSNYIDETHTDLRAGTINTLTIDENAYIQELKFNGKNLVINPTFTGTVANISFADGIVTDNVITGGQAAGEFTGTITTADGSTVAADGNGGLVIVANAVEETPEA